MPVDPSRQIINDKRVDAISLFKVIEPLVEKMSKGLKADMKQEGTKFAVGECGGAELKPGTAPDVIDPVKFWNLCSKRGITLADISKCMKVTKEAAQKLLSKNDLASICTKGAVPDASLTAAIPKGHQVPSAEDACLQLAVFFSSKKPEPILKDPRAQQ